MATDIPKLECPIDVMYVIHHALRAEAARVETLVGRLEEGGSLQPVRQAFYRWVMALAYHADTEDAHMTALLPDVPAARECELAHGRLAERLEDVQSCLTEEIGRTMLIARTQRHLFGTVVMARIAQDDHLEEEEAFVLPVIRRQLGDAQQWAIVRHLLLDEEAEDPAGLWTGSPPSDAPGTAAPGRPDRACRRGLPGLANRVVHAGPRLTASQQVECSIFVHYVRRTQGGRSMMAYGYSPEAPTAGALPHTTATAEASTPVTRLWPAILAVAAVGGSLALTCVAPFAAFAVATAGTLRRRRALGTMAVIWLVNQAVGFGALGYPWTRHTVLWGLAIGVAAVVATLAASGVLGRFRASREWLRLPLAFGAAFVVYETALMAVSLILGSGDIFAPALLGRLALIDAAWLGGLVVVHAALAAWSRPWRGAASRLARAS